MIRLIMVLYAVGFIVDLLNGSNTTEVVYAIAPAVGAALITTGASFLGGALSGSGLSDEEKALLEERLRLLQQSRFFRGALFPQIQEELEGTTFANQQAGFLAGTRGTRQRLAGNLARRSGLSSGAAQKALNRQVFQSLQGLQADIPRQRSNLLGRLTALA